MADYIERGAVREILSEMINEMNSEIGINRDGISMEYCRGWICALQDARTTMEYIPAADVRPERHGRWVSWEEAGNFILSPDRYECSVCHDAAQRLCNGFDLLSSYCPNCGAKMDGKDGGGSEKTD